MNQPPIYVTRPYLPALESFIPYLEEIWQSETLTNCGPMHQRLEAALCGYLGVEHVALFNNGTTALLTALQSLRITGEVITTPYSFVATAHSLLWHGLEPVFVDIDPHTLNLNPSKIEAAITPRTTAILPVHCYGTPCNTAEIQQLADAYNLRVIYDAAHAFAVEDAQGSILRHGDLSVLSFHATKVFNTFEGGAIVCPDGKTKQQIDRLKNFGFVDDVTVVAPGINGKMSEICAAFGLLQLEHVDHALQQRKAVAAAYTEALASVEGIRLLGANPQFKSNFGYYSVMVEDDYPLSRDELYGLLRAKNIYARRYFYPLISDFPTYRGLDSACRSNLPVAGRVSDRVLCLPIYPTLLQEDLSRVLETIIRAH